MLPVLFAIDPQDLSTALVLYLLAIGLVAYVAWNGWRGALGPSNGKGERVPATTQERATRAAAYGLTMAVLAGIGLYLALPANRFLGGLGKGVPIHTYGLMLASGFAGAVWLASKLAEREWPGDEGRKKKEQIYDLAFWVFLAGVGGSMLLFRIVNWKELPSLGTFLRDPARLVDCVTGGLVFYGGLIGATVAALVWARLHKVDFLRLADLGIPTVSLGQAFGRLGCFSAGCCWGDVAPSDYHFGVHFPGPGVVKGLFGGPGNTPSLAFSSQAADHRWVLESTGEVFEQYVPGTVEMSQWVAQHGTTLPLHPTQLYESIGQFVIFLTLIWLRGQRRFHGMIFGLWLMAYAVLRSSVELFRGDLERGTLRGLLDELGARSLAQQVPLAAWYNISTSQFISIVMFALGATILLRQGREVWLRRAPAAQAV